MGDQNKYSDPDGGLQPGGSEELYAFLTDDSGRRHPIKGSSCLVGRAPACDIVLAEARVSSRHALIHKQGGDEYFLVDLGSSNGTFVDGQRVGTPMRLVHGQAFEIAHLRFVFHDPVSDPVAQQTREFTAGTVPSVSTAVCWLLVLDIIDSTQLSRTLAAHQLPLVFGGWFSKCRQLVNEHKGTVDKFLGDALFAFWHDEDENLPMVNSALDALMASQRQSNPTFRWVLHRGEVSLGGSPTRGGERVMGSEVHLVFRFEKLGGSLNVPHLLSEAAAVRLKSWRTFRELGCYPLKGFDGDFKVYALDQTI